MPRARAKRTQSAQFAKLAEPANPLETLENIAETRRALEAAERQAVAHARQQGHTLARIGQALGMTRQAVHQKLNRTNHSPLAIGTLTTAHDLVEALTSAIT